MNRNYLMCPQHQLAWARNDVIPGASLNQKMKMPIYSLTAGRTTHLQLNVQLCHRTCEGAEVGQHMFTEVRYKACGVDVFLKDKGGIHYLSTTNHSHGNTTTAFF